MKPIYYILDGKKAVPTNDINEYSKLYSNDGNERRTVRRTIIGNGTTKCSVSTVFLGIDHNFSAQGDPVLFETMIFGGTFDNYQARYCTWEEAEEGHEKALKLILDDALANEEYEFAELVKKELEK